MEATSRRHGVRARIRFVLCALLVLLLALVASTTVLAKEPDPISSMFERITYIDGDGQEVSATCWVVESQNSWDFYCDFESALFHAVAFSGELNLDTISIPVQTETLVLMDGCKVTTDQVSVHGTDRDGTDLSICGQEEGTGTLEITKEGADDDYVAFGCFGDLSSPPEPKLEINGGVISITTDGGSALKVLGSDYSGTLSLNGGTVTVTNGGSYGVEVGTSLQMSGGSLDVTGGDAGVMIWRDLDVAGGAITATGTGPGGVGLLAGRNVDILDGTVTGTGPGAGIAHTYFDTSHANSGGTITIEGGTVTGTCAGTGDESNCNGPGIGSLYWDDIDITITGGTVCGTSVNGAGIGGKDSPESTASVDISIEGGTVTGASTTGAGVGTGRSAPGPGSSVTIRGGTVSASSSSGAGIGGGSYCGACTVTIEGGTVDGDSITGAGIGGGFAGDGGVVSITGGTVNAHASEDTSGFSSAGAAIGGGSSCTAYAVSIGGSDTEVHATAESGAGIGCGENGSQGSVTITDGVVYATSNGTSACIGGAYASGDCTVSISGGTVYAGLFDGGGQTDGAGIGGGEGGGGGTVTIAGGEVFAMSAKGGSGIGGGYGGAGAVVSISGGHVIAWSDRDDDDGEAIGCGQDGGDEGKLSIGYDASVLAGTDKDHAQYAVVSATRDGRVDACRQPWTEIVLCDHEGADTYPVSSPDHQSIEMHCARCSALVGQHVHHFVTEPVLGDGSSRRVWCTLGDSCPYGRGHPSTVSVSAKDATYDAREHEATVTVSGPIPSDVVDASLTYTPANGSPEVESDSAPVCVGTYKAVAKITLAGSNAVSTISTTLAIKERPVLVCPHDQVVLRGHAILQGVSHVALRPVMGVGESGPVTGHALAAVELAPTGAIEESCDIEASKAKVEDAGGGDVTANYELRYEKAQATVYDTIPDHTPPEPYLGLAYDGTEQGLVAPGTVDDDAGRYEIVYALEREGAYSRDVPTARDAGVYTVWWSLVRRDGDQRLEAIPAQAVTARIAPRRAELAWSATEFWYDGRGHAPAATVANLVEGDDCEVEVTGAGVGAGAYTARAVGLSGGNYALWEGSTLTRGFYILRRQVRVSGIVAADKVYDGTAAAELDLTGVTFENLVKGDILRASAKGAFEVPDAGDGVVKISGLSLGGADVANYALAPDGQQETTTARIIRRPVAVCAHDQATYEGRDIDRSTLAAYLAPRDGYAPVEGHELSAVTISTDWGGPGSHTSGTFAITPSGAAIRAGDADVTANYDFDGTGAYVTGRLTVVDTGPDFTPPRARALVYDGTDQPLVDPGEVEVGYTMLYSLTGDVGGQWSEEVPCARPAGDYTVYYLIRRDVAAGGVVGAIGMQSVDARIARRPVTVVPDSGLCKTYGEMDPTLTYSANGWAEPMVALVGTLSREGGEDVGFYAITQGSVRDGVNPDYLISFAGGYHLDILRRQVRVSGIVAADKVYDGTVAAELDLTGAALDNVLEGDEGGVALGGCSGSFADPSASASARVDLADIRLTGERASNYEPAPGQHVEARIARRPARVAARGQVVLWGREIRRGVAYAELLGTGAPESGAAPGQRLAGVELAPEGPVTSSGEVTPSGALIADAAGADATANYDLSYEPGPLLVMDVLPDHTPPEPCLGLAYDGTEQGLVAPGTVDDDAGRYEIVYALEREGAYSRDVPTARDAGVYTVWWSLVRRDGDQRLEAIPAQAVTARIAPRRAELAWSATEFWYDGRGHAPAATVANLVEGDDCEVEVTGAARAVGTYDATATGLSNENYRLPEDATTQFTIKLAKVVIPTKIIIRPGAPYVTSDNLDEVAQSLVTDEERGLVAEGVNALVWIQMGRIAEEDLSEGERAALDARLRAMGATAGWYLDISVYKQVGNEETRIRKTPTPLRLGVTVPDELRHDGRTHCLIRCHEDEATVLASTEGVVIDAQSDRFSPYVLAYQDVPGPGPSPGPGPGPRPSPTPTPVPPAPRPTPIPIPTPTPIPIPTPSPIPCPLPIPSVVLSPEPTPPTTPSDAPAATPVPTSSPEPTPSPSSAPSLVSNPSYVSAPTAVVSSGPASAPIQSPMTTVAPAQILPGTLDRTPDAYGLIGAGLVILALAVVSWALRLE